MLNGKFIGVRESESVFTVYKKFELSEPAVGATLKRRRSACILPR